MQRRDFAISKFYIFTTIALSVVDGGIIGVLANASIWPSGWFFGVTAVGFIAGQIGLLATWWVFGSQSILLRSVLSWLALVWLIQIAYFIDDSPNGPRNPLVIAANFPAVALAISPLLWLCRISFRWRLLPAAHAKDADRPRQFTIADLFIATTTIALALGLTRVADIDLPVEEIGFLAIAFGVYGLIIAVNIIPCLYILFIRKSHGLLAVGFGAALGFAEAFILAALSGGRSADGELMIAVIALQLSAISTLAAGMTLLRHRGIVLIGKGHVDQPAFHPLKIGLPQFDGTGSQTASEPVDPSAGERIRLAPPAPEHQQADER